MLLGLFAAADLVSFDAARDVDKTLDELIRSGDERRGAGYEMRANLSIIVERVHAYLHDGDGRKRGLVREAQNSFESSLNQYTETVRSKPGRISPLRCEMGMPSSPAISMKCSSSRRWPQQSRPLGRRSNAR
jgi:hypothetical protein